MRKVLITLFAVLFLITLGFAAIPNPNADPDDDWKERVARKSFVAPTYVVNVENPTPYVAGDYYIPQGTNALGFESLKAAVDSINAHGVTGAVVLLLDADTLREESITFAADLSVDNNVVVKPAAGRDVVLIVEPGASQGNGPQLIGFDKGYVTFDGSNDGTDSRNLIVTTETDAVDVPFGLNTTDADTVTLKNLVIKNLDNVDQNFKYGAVTNDIGGIHGFVVENCQIGTPERAVWRDGIAVWGDWTNGGVDAVIVNNEIHAGARGISTYIFGDCVFSNNTVYLHPGAQSTYSYNYGIYLSWGTSAEVHNNVVNAFEPSTGTVTKVGGIVSASNPEGAEFSVVNNMVSINAPDETIPVYGMLFMSSNDARHFDVYHNTFVVNDNASTDGCHGIGNSSTGPLSMDLKNNIIVNNHTGSTSSSALYIVSESSALTSDYNVLVSDQNFVNYQGVDYADLAAWQGAGQDANSISKDVVFESAEDLHLSGASVGDFDLAGTPLAEVLTDIDGDARSANYPYMGADEADEPLIPDYTAPAVFFSEYIEGSSNNKALEIYNGTGEEISLDNFRIAQSVNGGGWQYYHTFPEGATLAAGDVWVLLNSQTSTDLFAQEDADEVLSYPSAVHHNGDDARGVGYLLDDGVTWVLIDVIGIPDEDPGSGWDVAGVTNATKDH
ncbi:lamin tail domain-containing protein, partial [Vibrio sp.]|uniref:lamin tail domain-containing protein n=1 Tax=Vibrio sp. TaxID=678 RepID=UPI003D139B1B